MVPGKVKNVTRSFLNKCAKAGYKRICIGVRDSRIPYSESFPFGPKGSVFAWPEKPETTGFPAIWYILDWVGASWGCGNSHQHNYIDGMLTPGYYWLGKDGKWKREEKKK